MIRPLAPFRCSTRPAPKAAKGGAFLGLRALVAFFIALLQLTSALHFTLVPHTFSAALGGVVHVHGNAKAGVRAEPRAATRGVHAQALVADALSCAVDVCPFADAPHSSLPYAAATLSGAVAFGAASLLSEGATPSPNTRRVFLSAPKTSPPV